VSSLPHNGLNVKMRVTVHNQYNRRCSTFLDIFQLGLVAVKISIDLTQCFLVTATILY